MNSEILFHIRTSTRLIYFVTEEEDRFLVQLQAALKDKVSSAKVYSSTLGLVALSSMIGDWTTREHKPNTPTVQIQEALLAIYKEPTPKERKIYVILDPERWLQEPNVQRRILSILHQAHNDLDIMKVVICVSNHLYVPRKLARYTEVVHDTGLSKDDIMKVVEDTCTPLRMDTPLEPESLFSGLTSYEIQAALIQTFKRTKGYADPKMLASYRFKQLKKTNLIEHVDTSDYSFDQVGGVGRLKEWVKKTAATWTPEGRAFGLEPPKGVLTVGVWGTGKSLSVKCLANAWNLPMLRLDVGRLRTSAVGESESNTYRVTQIIESLAPCIVWMDEAEKSLSGGQSSGQTDGGIMSRMIGALSTWHAETKAPICLAMTSNSLSTLPIEFINRMNERWFFDLPSLEDRVDIIKIHLLKRNQDPSKYNLIRLAEVSTEMVGREIEQALLSAMTESFIQSKTGLDEDIFAHELRRKPRIVRTMADEIRQTLDWVGYDPTVDDGVRAKFAADPGKQDRKFSLG